MKRIKCETRYDTFWGESLINLYHVNWKRRTKKKEKKEPRALIMESHAGMLLRRAESLREMTRMEKLPEMSWSMTRILVLELVTLNPKQIESDLIKMSFRL
jgi:hypothetical protein